MEQTSSLSRKLMHATDKSSLMFCKPCTRTSIEYSRLRFCVCSLSSDARDR